MLKGFLVLALLAAATARPEPQFISAAPYAYSAAYTLPAAPVAPVVPTPTVPFTGIPATYSGLYPSSSFSYAYGYQNSISEIPVVNPAPANLLSAYTSLPYSSMPYTSLPYASATYWPY